MFKSFRYFTTSTNFFSRLFLRRNALSLQDKDCTRMFYVGQGYSRTSINTSIFRRSALVSGHGFQFIGYYDKKGRVVLGRRILGSSKWRFKRLNYKVKITDAHNVISLGLDNDGYLHVAFGMHCRPLRYLRSLRPLSLQMSECIDMDGVKEDAVTYPEFYTLETGELLFCYRAGRSGNGDMVMKTYDTALQRWSTLYDNLLDGEGERNAYWQMSVGADGTLHLGWVWRETPDVSTNHDVCYAHSVDGGRTWRRSDGTQYGIPINLSSSEVAWHVAEGSELINQTSIAGDIEGHPYIATYWRDTDNAVPQYRVLWNDGRSWHSRCVGERLTPFTLKGKGTKMVPMSRPLILVDDNYIYFIFRDIERGGRVIMAITGDITHGEWKIRSLSSFSVEAWEPCPDFSLWKTAGELQLFLQTTHQGDGEKKASGVSPTTPIYVLEVFPQNLISST